ncbi:lytic transglycosylase domain-containing protein [bacterium]|nr:lytic transglycosylase domain-containing protein [bacterium]
MQTRGNLTSRGMNIPYLLPEDIVNAYKKAVQYFNPKMDDNSARLIAQAILYFSLANKLDPRLVVAVIAVESGFDPKAVSPKGAMGLGQLMPQTAAGLGVKNPFDPLENIAGSIKLIRGHLEKFEGDPQQLALALACYNAGSGAVRKYGGIPPYKETQSYINKVISLYKKICGIN